MTDSFSHCCRKHELEKLSVLIIARVADSAEDSRLRRRFGNWTQATLQVKKTVIVGKG
jgi:hypothetical protein